MHDSRLISFVLECFAMLAIGLAMVLAAPALADNSFTYQGQLMKDGEPHNDSVDLEFRLFDQAENGLQVGPEQLHPQWPIEEGLFQVELDFGAVFDGQPLWLEVRADDVILEPRQLVRPAPMALFALTGNEGPQGPPGDSQWLLTGNDTYYDAGAVGIGVAEPASQLHVRSTDLHVGLLDSSSPLGSWLTLANTSDDGRYWKLVSTGSGNQEGAGNLLFAYGPSLGFATGAPLTLTPSNVGIGALIPQAPLHIRSLARNTDLLLQSIYNEPDGARARIRLHTPQHQWHIEGDGASDVFKIRSQTLGADRLTITPSSGINLLDDVNVSGALTANVKNFEIDHPLDPENRVLRHASIESPEIMNIYSGNIVTDEQGRAVVMLPDYFSALNTDYRYQLTVIDEGAHDQFVLARVSRRIEDNHFEIRTSEAHVEVSWQVSGIRHDAYALANPLIVEEKKP